MGFRFSVQMRFLSHCVSNVVPNLSKRFPSEVRGGAGEFDLSTVFVVTRRCVPSSVEECIQNVAFSKLCSGCCTGD